MAVLATGCCYNDPMTHASLYPGSMTAREFEKAVKQVRVSPTKLDRARRVLVDGKTVREVADSDGVTLHPVYRAVREVTARQKTKTGYWPGISPTGE